MITVLTFFWRDPHRRRDYEFNHDHVRTLKSMVARNLTMSHHFLCCTDDTIEGVDTVPLDWRTHVEGTCGLKLQAWGPDAQKKFGHRILLLDLDMVIVGNIDHLVWRPLDEVVMLRNPNYAEGNGRAFFQGSIQLFDAGCRPHVYDLLAKPWARAVTNCRFGGYEQAWLSEMLDWDTPTWDQTDGIYGLGRLGDVGGTVTGGLPENARIVVCPGNREPSQPEVQAKYPWIADHYR